MNTFTLKRMGETDLSTWGWLYQGNIPLTQMLERGPRNPTHPRVPAGTYPLVHRPFGTSKFDNALREEIGDTYLGILMLDTSKTVPLREFIEIHPANWQWDLRGCLAPGSSVTKDGNGDFMVNASRSIYPKMYAPLIAAIIGDGAELTIVDPIVK